MNYNEALNKLKEGNKKYLEGDNNYYVSQEERINLSKNGQHPYACIITCSDSRVVPEFIFSSKLGDLFIIRTAGNTISNNELGSIEYATLHLHVPLVIVMGHTNCGAVSSALNGNAEGCINDIINKISPNIVNDNIRESEINNVKNSVNVIKESSYIQELEKGNKLLVIPAIYDIESGIVNFDI